MIISETIIVCLVSVCVGLDLEHNCTFSNEMIRAGNYFGYPKPGDIPLLNRKIIRGNRVPILEHPYIASIRRQMVHYLTGTLIGGNLIITVAHPLVDIPIIELGVILGQNYNDRGSLVYTVIMVIFHELFDRNTLQADLALIKIYESVEFNVKLTVKPIRGEYADDFNLENRTASAFVTGWGRCDLTGNELCLPRASKFYPDEFTDPMLRSINIEITEHSPHCATYIKHEVKIHEGMLCVGPARQADHSCACLGVPGAPLVVAGKLLGVLSWGFGCGYHTDLPLIYTDVRYYELWIWKNVRKFSSLNEKVFEQMFETTKIAIITEWFSLTRSIKVEHEHPDVEIQPWKIDKELAMVDGDIYDVRDYYGKGDYHEEKMKRLQLFRMSIMDDPRLKLADTRPPQRNESTTSASDSDEYEMEYDYDLIRGNPYTNRHLESAFERFTTTSKPPVKKADDEYF